MTRTHNKGHGEGAPPHKQTSSTKAAHPADLAKSKKSPRQKSKGFRDRIPIALKGIPRGHFPVWGGKGIAGHHTPFALFAQATPVTPDFHAPELQTAASPASHLSQDIHGGRLPTDSPGEELHALLAGVSPASADATELNNQGESANVSPFVNNPSLPMSQCGYPSPSESSGMDPEEPYTPIDDVAQMPLLHTATTYNVLPSPADNVSGTSLQGPNPPFASQTYAAAAAYHDSTPQVPLGQPGQSPFSFHGYVCPSPPQHCFTQDAPAPVYNDGIAGQSGVGSRDVATNTLGLDRWHDEVNESSGYFVMAPGHVGYPVLTRNFPHTPVSGLQHGYDASSVASASSRGTYPSPGLGDAPCTHEPPYFAGEQYAQMFPVPSAQLVSYANEFDPGHHPVGGAFEPSTHMPAYSGQSPVRGTSELEDVGDDLVGSLRQFGSHLVVSPSLGYELDLPSPTHMDPGTELDTDDLDRLLAWVQHTLEVSPDIDFSHLSLPSVHAGGGYPTPDGELFPALP